MNSRVTESGDWVFKMDPQKVFSFSTLYSILFFTRGPFSFSGIHSCRIHSLINRISCDTPLWLLVCMPGSRLDNQIPHLTDLSPGHLSPPQRLWRGVFVWTSVGARLKAPCFSYSFRLFFLPHPSFYLFLFLPSPLPDLLQPGCSHNMQ